MLQLRRAQPGARRKARARTQIREWTLQAATFGCSNYELSTPETNRSKLTVSALTHREREVLKQIAEGYTTKELAAILGIAFKTAACHRAHIMEKLGMHNTARLVRYALGKGIVEGCSV